MPVFKNESNNTWYVMARYMNWKGERKQKCKRGFSTKREAQEWERTFQQQNAADMDMSFEAFTQLYEKDIRPRLKENTWLTKEHIIKTKILPYFGKRNISEITTKDVIAWQNELLAYRNEKRQPYSQTYLKTVHNHNICMLIVHHTRKQAADDKFDMISGTNGLLGAADGAFILSKDKRTSNNATLEVSGRDQQDQRVLLKKNAETLAWELDKIETELWKEPPEPLLERIAELINAENPAWSGTPTELCDYLSFDIKPSAITQKLNVNVNRLKIEYKIAYHYKRTHEGRKITLQSFEYCQEKYFAESTRYH